MGAERHNRPVYFLADRNEIRGGIGEGPVGIRPATGVERAREFRFSEMVPRGTPPTSDALLRTLAERMVADHAGELVDGDVPAGFTYLGQFVDHDMTLDRTRVAFGAPVTLPELEGGRSPALDLDSLYGLGPEHASSTAFYHADGVRLRLGRTKETGLPAELPDAAIANTALDGFDLPRVGLAATVLEDARAAAIPDRRNDENLIVGQVHLAFMRFHNAVVAKLAGEQVPSALLFARAQAEVIRHYQWMLVHDFLPRIVDPAIVTEVFARGRRVFEADPALASVMPTMPIEFSVAAYRLGHSMIRDAYDWNVFFHPRAGALAPGSLDNMFRFSGTSGNLSPPPADPENPLDGTFERLPSNWIIDFTRMFDFVADGGGRALAPRDGASLNLARRIDTRMTNPLAKLPLGSFGSRGGPPADPMELNLAFRNLVRGRMVGLATAQEVARHFSELGAGTPVLTSDNLLRGAGGVRLDDLPAAQEEELVTATPLWFYALREAEMLGGRLGPIGGRIVAEVFHRAIEGSRVSILRTPGWKPDLGREAGSFRMTDLLLRAYDAGRGELHPLRP